MQSLVRLTILAGLMASIPQTGSAQRIEDVYRPTEFYCPQSYVFAPSRSRDRDVQYWDNGTVEFPFLKYDLKKTEGVWDIKCLYGFVEHSPNGGIRGYYVTATLVRRVRAGMCAKDQHNPYAKCYPPSDRGLDVYQPDSGPPPPPPGPGADEYQPGNEAPEPPPPISRGSDVYQPPSTPQPAPFNRGLDVYQPESEPPEPPPEPEDQR